MLEGEEAIEGGKNNPKRFLFKQKEQWWNRGSKKKALPREEGETAKKKGVPKLIEISRIVWTVPMYLDGGPENCIVQHWPTQRIGSAPEDQE